VVKRLLYRRGRTPKRTGLLYTFAAIAFVVASVGPRTPCSSASARRASARSSWRAVYLQCPVQQPDGSYDDVHNTGACPGPSGTPVTMVYLSGGDDQPMRAVLGTRSSLAPLAAVWGGGTLTGCGLLIGAALKALITVGASSEPVEFALLWHDPDRRRDPSPLRLEGGG
jgi:hypothetical protein